MGTHRYGLAALLIAQAALVLPPTAGAQQLPPGQQQQQPRAAQPQPQGQRQPAKGQPPKETTRAAEGQGDAQLRQRIEQLEEQLADLQVEIGTLASLGRGGQGSGGAGQGGGVDQARISSLETQIGALASQMEQLSAQVRQLSGGRRSEAPPASALPGGFGGPPQGSVAAGSGFGPAGAASDRQGASLPAAAPRPGQVAGFGSTTVTPGGRDPIGQLLGREAPQNASAAPPPAGRLPPPAAAPGGQGGNPRELYETAYGYLLQQDYGAAEVAFEELLRRFPQDRLAPDAQYWLGESLYFQRRFKPAGQAFLKVIEQHKGSDKVPNSLLKLAMSLEQLGQKDCGIFAELEQRQPNAPADVKAKARTLKQRQGC